MKRITYTVPVKGGTVSRDGFKVWLKIGDVRCAFVLQQDGTGYALAHYASGKLVSGVNNLKARMLMHYVSNPSGYRSHLGAWRACAQDWLDDVVDAKGADVVRDLLMSAPVLNGPKRDFADRVRDFEERNSDGHY